MKTSNLYPVRRLLAGLTAGLVLGGMFGTSSRAADMYRPGTPTEGGVPAAAVVTLDSQTTSNATLSWYGMRGWYRIEGASNSGPYIALSTNAASEHAWSATVTNPFGDSGSFRLYQSNYFAGSSKCSSCHGDKHAEWQGTAHSVALSALSNIGMGSNPSCLPCHTVGFGQQTGYTNLISTPNLTDVGCETCHGPAGWHKDTGKQLIRPAVSIDPMICGGCHTDSHHPTYEEYEESLHAEVNDDIKYGFANGVYYPDTIVMAGTNVVPFGSPGSSNVYGFYVTTNANLSLKTNQTTGIIHSQMGNPRYVYDPGQDRAAQCGVCHSAATRMAMLNDYEARLAGRTNALVMATAHDASSWSAACATCHDPHSADNPAQLRNPTRSTNYYTMPTTTDKRTVISTNYNGSRTTNVFFMNTTFASLYDPNIQVCAQCHNSRGARWDGRGYGLITNNVVSLNVTNTVYVDIVTNVSIKITTNLVGGVETYLYLTNSYVIGRSNYTVVIPAVTNASVIVGLTTNINGLSRPPHHSPQYNVLVGILQPDYFNTNSSGVATNWIQRHGAGVSSTSGNYNTNQCATCHVPSYAVNSNTNVTGHTFKMDTKNCTLSGCHSSVPLYEETMLTTTNSITRIVTLLNQWAVSKGPGLGLTNGANNWDYTTTGALAPTPNTPNAGPPSSHQATRIPDAIKQARFNIYMLLHDGSLGVHNPRYASALTADAESKVLSQFPLANFRAYTTAGFTPLSVGFTNLGTGVTGYSWNFGDTQTSTEAAPTNIYASPGTYPVTLTATDGVTSETVVRTNYINVATRPVVTFTGGPATTGASPLTVNFTNTSTSTNSVTNWRWTINGQSIYSQDTVYTFTNVYTTNITFNIALRGYTPGGNITVTSNAFVTVTPPSP